MKIFLKVRCGGISDEFFFMDRPSIKRDLTITI